MSVNRTIKIGDQVIPRIGLGTNRLAETPANIDFIRQIANAGVGLIDTAHLYVGGSSEKTIGAALAGRQHSAIVATKGGFNRGDGQPDALRAQIEQSLRSLRTDRIDLYYLHRVDPDTPLEESVAVLAEYRERGTITNVGLSQVTVEQIERARAILPIAAVQSQYNVGDRAWDEELDYCTREEIVFVPFYPLHGEHGALRDIAQAHGSTQSQIALAWLLQRSPQILPIPGSLSLEHVRENVAALDIELSQQEIEQLS